MFPGQGNPDGNFPAGLLIFLLYHQPGLAAPKPLTPDIPHDNFLPGASPQSEEMRPVPPDLPQRNQFVIFPVQADLAVRSHIIKNLRLCPQNAISVNQIVQMALADIGDHTNVRPGHFAQAVHFPEFADAHLHHSHLMLFPDVQQCQRHAYLIVEIAFCLQNPVPHGQYPGDKLLGAGFARTSCDSHHFHGQLPPVGLCHILQGLQRILHQQITPPLRPVGIVFRFHLLRGFPGQYQRCPSLKRRRNEFMSVYPFPFRGYKNTARLNQIGIDCHGTDTCVNICPFPEHQFSTACFRNFPD